jgi:hypothetical protein
MRATLLPTADEEISRSRPAAVKLRVSATLMKAVMPLRLSIISSVLSTEGGLMESKGGRRNRTGKKMKSGMGVGRGFHTGG